MCCFFPYHKYMPTKRYPHKYIEIYHPPSNKDAVGYVKQNLNQALKLHNAVLKLVKKGNKITNIKMWSNQPTRPDYKDRINI